MSLFSMVRSFAAATLLAAATLSAATITYETTNLPDSVDGDVWQYTYAVSNHTFAEREAFSILFDSSLYSLLDPTSVVPGWDILVLQPDSGLPDPGRYEPLALFAGAPGAGPFNVQFIWNGAGAPGPQAFELIQYDADWNPTTTFTGTTVPFRGSEVPEPSTWMMLGTGAAALLIASKRRS